VQKDHRGARCLERLAGVQNPLSVRDRHRDLV